MESIENDTSARLIELTSHVVTAHLSNNSVPSDQVPFLISTVYSALAGLGTVDEAEEPATDPAVSVRSSVKHRHIVCLDCGRKMKLLKRHLMTEHGLTVEEYRERWNLSPNYPMVAPDYAETRRALAVRIGLGRKPGQKRGRRKKAG